MAKLVFDIETSALSLESFDEAQLTFYGVSGRDGAARRFNLDFYCKSFGIDSPKSHGVTGMDVNTLLAEGRHPEIAEYCLRDVRATVWLCQI